MTMSRSGGCREARASVTGGSGSQRGGELWRNLQEEEEQQEFHWLGFPTWKCWAIQDQNLGHLPRARTQERDERR